MVVVAALCVAAATPLVAQSVTQASVSGSLRSDSGLPVGTALVTLTPVGPGAGYQTTSGPTGLFNFGLLRPGSYEVRVEALGYRPLVARVLTVAGGEQRALELVLTTEAPPVVRVDTVSLGSVGAARWRAGGMQLGGWEIDGLPHAFDDLASITSLATEFDESFGSQGLPGDMTVLVVDGLPFYRATHPVARSEHLPDALFPRSVLASVAPTQTPTDIERVGAAGGYVNVETLSSEVGGGFGFEGSVTGPGWTSSQLDLSETPSLFGFQAAMHGGIVIKPGASQLTLSGEALRRQSPLAPRISPAVGTQLTSLTPLVVETLTQPGIETYDRYSGLVRYDSRQGQSNQFFVRAAGAMARREYDGSGPVSLGRSAALPQESVDFSIAGGMVSRASSSLQIEVRGGVSGSARDFKEAAPGLRPAFLVNSGALLGDVPSSIGESSRLDVVAVPTLRYQKSRNEVLKTGLRVRISRHTMLHSAYTADDIAFGDPEGLNLSTGYGRSTNAIEQQFSTHEYGIFAQYERSLGADLSLTAGLRYDYERLPGDAPRNSRSSSEQVGRNELWRDLTGLDNSEFPNDFHQVGATGSLTFDPGRTGRTRVFLAGGLQYGDVDPRAVYEVFATSTDARQARFYGPGLVWPDVGVPATSPEIVQIAMLGPDTRPPRSIQASAGVMRRLGMQMAVFARASFRRTDFLLRRRNLNLRVDGSTLDPYGREIYGPLVKDGAMITTNGPGARAFPVFGDAWALDPDGWSRYMGFTAGLEHTSQLLEAYAAYTYSQTTDNWIGAGSGSIGGTLPPGLPATAGEDWAEGTSDFDIPHRIAGGVTAHVGPLALTAAYRFRSGTPFTPGYRIGVDANGDGSIRNDVAYVPSAAELGAVLERWSCLTDQVESFSTRNSCRGPDEHSFDARIEFGLGAVGGYGARITLDGFNLFESEAGVIDDALLLVFPDRNITSSPDGAVVTIPTTVNPNFGAILYPSSRGRVLRLGVRLGG